MKRTSVRIAGFTMKYIQGTGKWDEDHVNDFNAMPYLSARSTMMWYYSMERHQTRSNLRSRRSTQSSNNNQGLHHSGKGAFAREMERKGIQVDKYPLTTTTGARRVAEMVVLRRQKLEDMSADLMAKQRESVKLEKPSKWFDESKGPLNPRFVKAMQPHYKVNIQDLPETPIVYHN
ncbi:hypothetical protein, conserved [Angomonas deanei]|uniref:Uncharacterized protein n=1 Tax=Angomonas deanei TaxID=59799 RepID=A0A7G2CG70_9TRYP|nr:hypothetical protein, conserved [Angomonas deanei]